DLNGYHLDDAAIDFLEQTPMAQPDGANLLDPQGIPPIPALPAIDHLRTHAFPRTDPTALPRHHVAARATILEPEPRPPAVLPGDDPSPPHGGGARLSRPE
ncbi:hypothetical protein DTB58_30170, partial [Streptomyces griseus]|nr:hypothetical protein [Streptomyces griseus]